MYRLPPLRPLLLTLSFLTLVTTAAWAQPASDDDPVATYRAFVETVSGAESFRELLPFMPAGMQAQLGELSEEQDAAFLERTRGDLASVPEGAWELLDRRDEERGTAFVLRGEETSGDTRRTLEGEAHLILEDDGWKIARVMDWNAVAVLPASTGDALPVRGTGPGAEPVAGGFVDASSYALAGSVDLPGDSWDGMIVFDPSGHYAALGAHGGGGSIHLLDLNAMETVWSFPASHAYGSLSFRPDGRALAFENFNVYRLEIVPLDPNLASAPPADGRFFSRPPLPRVEESVARWPRLNGLAYHPSEPLLALGIRDEADPDGGAIALYPTGEGLWLPSETQEGKVWATGGEPRLLAWSPSGDRLAWTDSAMEPGTPVFLASYPGGDHTSLSRPDFVPGRIVFGPDGRHVASIGHDGEQPVVLVWDVETGEEVAAWPGIDRLAFAPDGLHVYAVRDTGMMVERGVADEILVWKIGEPEPTASLPAFPTADGEVPRVVSNLAVSPNGRFLVAVSGDGEVKVWDTTGGG